MELDENKDSFHVQQMLAEDVERIANIYNSKYGVSKTSFYRLLLNCSTRFTEEREALDEAWQYLKQSATSVSLSGKQEALENYFECVKEMNNCVEEIVND